MTYDIGQTVFGNWRIIREIGEGASGTVYEIERTDIAGVVRSALKVISIPKTKNEIVAIMNEGYDEASTYKYFRDILDDVIREIEMMATVRNHPNVVHYEDHMIINHIDSIGWDVLIRMEMLTPMDEYLSKRKTTELDVINIAMHICSALDYCHNNGVIHRDIKPANLFMDGNGYCKLGDFGIARTIDRTTANMSKIGTPNYMAPEIYMNRPYGLSADIYSLGMVMYRMLNRGRPPFLPLPPAVPSNTDRELATARRMKGEEIPPPADASPELAKVIIKACNAKPKLRYASAAELSEALVSVRDNLLANGGAENKKNKRKGLILGLSIGLSAIFIAGIVALVINLNKNADVLFGSNNSSTIVMGQSGNDRQNDPDSGLDSNGKPTPDKPATAKRTVMVYMVGSNLESPTESGAKGGAATEDIYEMLAADIPEGVNVVLECGGANEWEYPTVPDGAVSRHVIDDNSLVLVDDLGKTTMTNAGNLTDFIKFSAAKYPAENYTLVLWNHGGGIPVSFGSDQLGDAKETLTDTEIQTEIKNSGISFDAVIFDACNMCTLEIGVALQGNSDYMVGAQSYVNGIGIYYSNWLAQTDRDTQSFCEVIVEDYMAALKKNNLVGAMSVIRLDCIEEVYIAYREYIKSVNNNMYAGSRHDYEDYVKARSNCGQYYGTDSVDLTTLATRYETDMSGALVNAVNNAVVYTKSDMPYGHGISAYSPSADYFYLYNDARPSLVSFKYSNIIIDFYDHLVSEMLSFCGADVVAAYGGDWFVEDYEISAAGTSDTIYHLDVTDRGSYYGVGFTSDSWPMISNIATAVVIQGKNNESLVLGQDYQSKLDSDNYIGLVNPKYWYWINGTIATFYATSDYYDEKSGKWSRTGYIPVTVDGKTAALYIYFDQDNAGGLIQGYYYFNYETLSREDNTMYMIAPNQKFDLYYPFLDADGKPYYLNNNSPVKGSELKLELYYINLSEYTTYGYIEVTDVYGKKYQTDKYCLSPYDVIP